MKIQVIVLGFMSLVASFNVTADEGMWLPLHLKRLNEVDMQKHGLQLTAKEIYDINNASLKDAIVSLGGFCTAEMISNQGLMLTNHHCAFGAIQENSSVDKDYLTDGFWAMSMDKELPASDTYAAFLVRMEDVSKTINDRLTESMSKSERDAKISLLADSLEEAAVKGTHYNARVKSFFHGNEFYLFVYETFNDVRLVGAPPSSIGKFGGDTDNWMWPRHTGDFSLLRVYCGKDGKPADYSPDNIPYTPKHHLPISLNGVKKDDYAMIMGYPGSTDRFLTSYGIKEAIELDQPARVKIRAKKLEIYKNSMDSDPKVRIQYAAKYAQVSNYYKYFKGQTKGLKKLNVYEKKKEEENQLIEWIEQDKERKEKYNEAIPLISDSYRQKEKYALISTYLGEAVFGCEILKFSGTYRKLVQLLGQSKINDQQLELTIDQLRNDAKDFFKDYSASTDKKVVSALMKMYYEDISKEFHPEKLTEYHKKYKGNFQKFSEDLFKKSIFGSQEKVTALLSNPSLKLIEKDPAYQLYNAFVDEYIENIRTKTAVLSENKSKGRRLFTAALREMKNDKNYYPDANSTMRVTYGNVLDYYPRDAVYYKHFTTIDGILEKENPNNDEFIVPQKLAELIRKKDFGQYVEDGTLKVCFITNADITGGNSGSPVINGKGQLIGCAFDGNWEAMSGDIAFEPDLQRTIAVDIRYVLFIIEKFAGANHLIKEMTLVKDTEQADIPKSTEQIKVN